MPFTARSAPGFDVASLRSVRRALNSPVVAIAELPVGPASAALALHADSGAAPRSTLAVRCRRTGDAVFFGGASASQDASDDTALTFAESMGFVFDDPEAGADARQIWREFAGSALASEAPEAPRAPLEEAQEPQRLWLSKFRWLQDAPGRDAPGLGTRS